MKTILSLMLTAFILTPSTVSTPSQTEDYFKRLDSLEKAFLDRFRDFLDLSAALASGDPEEYTLSTLESTADEHTVKCNFLKEELSILALVVDSANKDKVQRIVAARVAFHLKSATRSVGTLNRLLLKIRKPAVAAQATKLKRDLRDLQETLEEIAKTLPEVDVHEPKTQKKTSASLEAD